MLEIISINNNKESKNSNETLWKNLLIESYNKYRKYNDFSVELSVQDSIDLLFSTLKEDTIHIVLKRNKFIGFFINQIHTRNKEITFKVFSHPLSCPMSIRSITKAALFRAFIIFIEDRSLNQLEFTTWHPSLVSLVKRFIPELQINLINSTTIICYKEITKLDLENFNKILSRYLDDFKHLNKNHYKILY